MVNWTGLVVPVLVTVAIWFLATGLVAWLDNRDRSTFPRSLLLGGFGAIAGLGLVVAGSVSGGITGIYAGFAGALLIWTWHEIAFLTGAVAGPERKPCPANSRGLRRFRSASATVIHHEIALAATVLLLFALTWHAPSQIAAHTFALLFGMRLSTKLNIFHGVPNMSLEILPPHLSYLKTYFGPARFGWPLAVSLAATATLTIWLGTRAMAAPLASPDAVSASLLFALAALGMLEHLMLATPFRDGALWGWALPSRPMTHTGRGLAPCPTKGE